MRESLLRAADAAMYEAKAEGRRIFATRRPASACPCRRQNENAALPRPGTRRFLAAGANQAGRLLPVSCSYLTQSWSVDSTLFVSWECNPPGRPRHTAACRSADALGVLFGSIS